MSTDDPTSDPALQDAPPARSPDRPLLIWTLIASALLHMSPLLTLLHLDLGLDMPDADVEWLGQFEDLSGLGESSAGREVAYQAPAPPEEPPKPAPAKPEEPEPEPPAKPEEPEPEAPKEQPKPKPKPKPKPSEVAAADPAPKPAEQAPEDAPEEQEPEGIKDAPAGEEIALPGMEYTGPSKLPSLQSYAPGNARMTAMVRLDRLREAKYAEPLGKLIQAVPDYRILLEATELDPVRDLDMFFMASANPQYLQETFLAVRHSLPDAALRAQLKGRFPDPPPWTTYNGLPMRDLVPESSPYQDPRKLLLASDKMAVVARPEWLPELVNPFGADDPRAPRGSMLDGLARIEEAVEGDDIMALVSARGLIFLAPGVGKLPRFEAVKLVVRNPKRPQVTIDLQFRDAFSAGKFVQQCGSLKQQIIDGIPGASFLRLDSLIRRLTCEAGDTYVVVKGSYTEDELLRIIQLATPFIPRPPALDSIPKAAPKPVKPVSPASQAADMGAASPALAPPDAAPDRVPDAPHAQPPEPAVPPLTEDAPDAGR